MRTAFVKSLLRMAKEDKRVTLITGDLGFGVLAEFMNELPRQFVNVGVAEQNMIGVATGMALNGKTVFVYSIANFPVLRCFEQIRNDPDAEMIHCAGAIRDGDSGVRDGLADVGGEGVGGDHG